MDRDFKKKPTALNVNGHRNEKPPKHQYENLDSTIPTTKEEFVKKIRNMNKEEARLYMAEYSSLKDRKQSFYELPGNNTNQVSEEPFATKEMSNESEIKKGEQSVDALSKRFESHEKDFSKYDDSVSKQNQNRSKRKSLSEDTSIPSANAHSRRSKSVGPKKHNNPARHLSISHVSTEKKSLSSSEMKPRITDTVMGYKLTNKTALMSSTNGIKSESISTAVISQQNNNDILKNKPPKRSKSVSNEVPRNNLTPLPPPPAAPLPILQNSATLPHRKTLSYSFVENNQPKIIPDIFVQSRIVHELDLTTSLPKSQLPQQQPKQPFDFLKTRKSINILILGETGVGKSTWINAFVNYLSYGSLREAMSAGSSTLIIPTQFSMYDKNVQQHQIRVGGLQDKFLPDEGESVTKSAKVYLIQHGKYDIHLVDTPGINDTSPGQDDKNIQNILKTIAPFKELHAICFLFDANKCRLLQSFRENISKLLSNLSKSALANVCVVFTNARGTFFKPGNTMVLLKAYFQELQEKEGLLLSINENNTFCLDNEAFRFLCAYFSNIQFSKIEMNTYSESWMRSSSEVIRLLNYAASLRPHVTSETLSINETRTWILQLVHPIMKILELIHTNLQKLQESVEDLQIAKNDIEKLSKKISEYSLKITRLHKPQTVCNNENCVHYENIAGKRQRVHKTVCHDKCHLPYGSTKESFPDISIKRCKLFLRDERCKFCGCSWMDHSRRFFDEEYVAYPIQINAIHINQQKDVIRIKEEMLQKAKQRIDGYSSELNTILNAMATFSLFLYQNGICQKYDIFGMHLQHLIEIEEKMVRTVPDCDNKNFNQLTAFLTQYQNIRRKTFNSPTKLSLITMQIIRQNILTLPLTGSKILQMFNIHVDADIQDHAYEITRFQKPSLLQHITAV